MKQRIPPQSTAGYSMIEMLTVLVLVAILASLAGPPMGTYVNRNKTRRALDQVAGDIAYARILAIRAGEPSVLMFQNSTDYAIWLEDEPGNVLKSVDLGRDYPGVTVTAPTDSGRIEFDSRGLVRDAGSGRIVAAIDGIADTLLVTAAGRVYRAY